MKDLKKVDLVIIQKPVSVKFDCPHCEFEVEMNYGDFVNEMGTEYCDWEYSKFNCPNCSEEIGIDNIDWD